MWVPLIENRDFENEGGDFFIREYLQKLFAQDADIDTILLACTHYPLMQERIQRFVPNGVKIISQGRIVADSLAGYLQRHPEIDSACSKDGKVSFFTTDSTEDFDSHGSYFYGREVRSKHVDLAKPPGKDVKMP